jgi:ubiquinone/menaquinone biosynthesis C-methylase UbiE
MNATALDQMKQGARAAWAAGDYPSIAERQLWGVGPKVVQRASVGREDDVLDVACGTGNAALRAAQAGASVVGLDLTPELLDVGRRLAGDAGLSVEWVEGDAEQLPFPDASFDVVLSAFGCMFAPRHEVAAHELTRVLRPGGRLVVTAWTPHGAMGQFFKTIGAYMPPPPPEVQPPVLWGAEPHVTQLFEGTGVELEFEHDSVQIPPFDTVDEGVEYMTSKFGPLIMARPFVEQSGRWDDLITELAGFIADNDAAEYLVTIGRKR